MPPGGGLAQRPAWRALGAAGLVLVAAFSATTLPGVRSSPTFHPLYDGWLQGSAYVVLALVATARPWAIREHRALWLLVAGGVACRALGFVLYLGYVRLLADPPTPSVADVAWVSADLVMLVAMWVLLRTRVRGRSVDLALDALVVGLTVAGLSFEILFHSLMSISPRPDADELVATNLVYPVLDIAALAVVTGALMRLGWRSWSTALLTAGIAVSAVVDATFAYQASAGTYHPGTPLSALALLGAAAMSFAGWAADGEDRASDEYQFSRVAVAAALGVLAVCGLVYADLRSVPAVGVFLTAAALMVGIFRALRTVSRNTDTAVTALERLADDRQRLLDRLVQAQEDERARIAADVHDDSVQALAAVELRLGLLRRQLVHDPALQQTAETLSGSVSEAIGRLRTLLFDLESPAVETDLATALAVAAEEAFGGRLRWRVSGETGLVLPESLRVTAYRIAREAMANVVRHADAGHVEITLGRTGAGFEVTIEDDGRGFDPEAVRPRPGHLGIPAMADRATIAGGRLLVERRDEGGTRVRLWLPVPPTTQSPEGST